MNQLDSKGIQRPRTDDRLLWDIVEGIIGYQAVLVAYDLKLFPVLAENPRTLSEVCEALNIAQRPAEVLLTICVSLNLLQVQDNYYSLKPIAEDYLLDSSPTYFGEFLNIGMLADPAVMSFESVKRAFLTNRSQVYEGEPIFQSLEEQVARAHSFTHMMHGHSMGPALAWPDAINLDEHRIMLDIGGGSGAHAIGATQRWTDLHAIVFDLAPVCEVTDQYIARYALQSRIQTHVGDMWNDPFPPADLHFYADIFHDWPLEKGRLLAKKSFESLEPGGRIIIHEMLYNDEKTGPFTVAGYGIAMLLWTEGQQFSGRELSAMLTEAGFTDIDVKPTFGYWSVVTGRKL